jgi:uncharacterized protein YgbK (DUF1537 family)
MASGNGSLVVVGSHVPKTTSQLESLLATGKYKNFEINVREILKTGEIRFSPTVISQQVDQLIAAGQDVLIYTSRSLETGTDEKSSLQINASVSEFLVNIVKGLTIRPKFIIAKGGITSSDLASKALGAKKAWVLGPVIPGVPVWKMDEQSKFPGIIYVVFPGNVGEKNSLEEVCRKFDVE